MAKEKSERFRGVLSFISNVCEKSLVTGLPEILSAKRISTKFIRFTVFALCMFGFVYQSLEFMNLYWAYSTILDIQIQRPLQADMPALTVCDINGILMSKYCQYHKCSATEDEYEFCGCYTSYCEKRKLLPGIVIRDSEDEFNNVSFLPQPERIKYMIRPSEFILSCKVKRTDSNEVLDCGEATLNPSSSSTSIQPSVCYNLHSLLERPHDKPKRIPTTTVIDLKLFLKPEDYDFLMPVMQKQISIDYPYKLTNPFVEGHYLAVGKKYHLYVKETVKTLLKPPYDTDCYDYMTEWIANGGKGPVSQSECLEHCRLEKFRRTQTCIPYILWYPHNFARCPLRCIDVYCTIEETFVPNFKEFTAECATQCKPACRQVTYDIVKEEVPDTGELVDFTWLRRLRERMDMNREAMIRRGKTVTKLDGHSFVRISYEKYEKTIYVYSPKYDVIETFSYIGGYVGIWLGISLIVAFDFLETVVAIVRYSFRKKHPIRVHPKQDV